MLSRWREETVNTNKADGFGLCGSLTVLYLSCCSVPSSFGAPGYEKLGRMEAVKLPAPVRRLALSVGVLFL